ncbi:MAG: hypothetical protein KQ78_00343 [Candidatus Izimaplasma bacterium HR2]|nr:MAG: hypothetical protein KQ78_00343 [Candidatus Izimaplasma bacterium HR2]
MYNYINGKKRILNILSNNTKVEAKKSIPKSEKNFNYANGIKSWISVININISNYDKIIKNDNTVLVAKVLKSFSTEVIDILNSDDLIRKIGVEGNHIYAIYSTPYKNNIHEVALLLGLLNTYMLMLNKILEQKKIIKIKYKIGMSSGEDIVVRAHKKETEVAGEVFSQKLWIGNALYRAINLSKLKSKESIIVDSMSYKNFIDEWEKINSDCKEWFKKVDDYYVADIVRIKFDAWIDEGMSTI